MDLRRIYCGARQEKVRVMEPNGEARHFCAPITARDLLQQYTHRHCVRDVSGSILPLDAELEGGNTYLLLPLPRLSPLSQPGSNSRPCDGIRRAKPWQPSLDMISENKTLPKKSNKEKQPVKEEKKKQLKPVQMKSTHASTRNQWERETAMGMPHVAPFGFIF